MYLMGMTFLRRRKSSFIHGAGDDAQDISDHLAGYLNSTSAFLSSDIVLTQLSRAETDSDQLVTRLDAAGRQEARRQWLN
ncbi:MAG: hypothetical protein CM1200mP20_05350 [Pseudomonadota bacterium]|nr:MAG: hypothetical protein CM1200mP20_05350 [Pseudomonadota bacterium]